MRPEILFFSRSRIIEETGEMSINSARAAQRKLSICHNEQSKKKRAAAAFDVLAISSLESGARGNMPSAERLSMAKLVAHRAPLPRRSNEISAQIR